MKKIFVFALAASLIGFASSCDKEELEPTNIEKGWSKGIDLSNDYVKRMYNDNGVAILTEFNDTLDVFYQGSDYGVITTSEITHVKPEQKADAIKWLKENILDCFSDECIRNYFPRRIFLCEKLTVNGTPGYAGGWVEELKYTNNLYGVAGAQHAFPFAQGMAISVNIDILTNEETAIDYKKQFRNDIMTLICHELFMNNNWLEGIENNPDLFPSDVVKLYGHDMKDRKSYDANDDSYVKEGDQGMWNMWYWGYPVTDYYDGDEITYYDSSRMSLEGFFQFGFPDHGQNDNKAYGMASFVWPTGTPKEYTNRYGEVYVTDGYFVFSGNNTRAPDTKYRDARNLILALADLNDAKLTVYGDLLIERLCIVADYLKGFGIDFRKFNPSVDSMFNMYE